MIFEIPELEMSAMPLPIISVVTISKNSQKTIRECIDSVISQKSSEIEYIIVDGNSTDGTKEIIKRFGENIDIYLSENDAGISDAFNKGVNLATGRYIAFLNSDDYYLPGVLSKVLAEIKRQESYNPDSGYNVYHGNLEIRRKSHTVVLIPKQIKRFRYILPVYHPTTFVPVQLMRKFPFSPDYKIAMDYDSLSKIYKSGASFIYLPFSINSMGGQGISHQSIEKGYREVMNISIKNLGVNRIEAYAAFLLKLVKTKINSYLKNK